ncbi:MAG: DUF368 domain-containing protein [Bacteroidales bacterium]
MHPRLIKQYIFLVFRGMAMGAADLIPGVSGGTIAFITGIYEELINSIKSVNRQFFSVLFSSGIPAAWKHINGNFLVAVFAGIFISILSLARVISWLLQVHPKLVWAFFFGLIVASTLHVGRKIDKWKITTILSLIAGAVIAAWITLATPATSPQTWWFVFLSGSIAIIAMILPGISGSFILLLLGKYEYILNAVKDLNIDIIGIFIAGCIVGIISFSNLISWLFKKFPDVTMAVLTGFMLGSLNKLWPWKEITAYQTDSLGEMVPLTEKSISPFVYQDITGNDHLLGYALLSAVVGFLIIFIFDVIAFQKQKSNPKI